MEAINDIENTCPEFVKNNSIIFGLGDTGLSVARFLRGRDENFILVDTRETPPNIGVINELFPESQKYLGANEQMEIQLDLTSFDQLVISPGLARQETLVERALAEGISVIGDIELFYQHAKAPIIAITGSNGKSSVVTLVTDILKASGYSVLCGGNIGIPALDLLKEVTPDYYVLEVSSFQLESVQDFSPKIAAILNLSADHMDRYDSFESYVAAKLNITKNAKHTVIHHAEKERISNINAASLVTFSGDSSSRAHYKVQEHDGTRFLGNAEGQGIDFGALNLSGAHNIENALAAIAITDLAGASQESQTNALRHFAGLEHRTEMLGRWNDVAWVNDSKGTNVGATVAAINGVLGQSEGILIAGGVGKGANFDPLRVVIQKHVAAVILFGRDAKEIAAALEGATRLYFAADLEAAVALAKSLAKAGSTVLFSPACASFDMFDDYQQRGKVFKALVTRVNQQ